MNENMYSLIWASEDDRKGFTSETFLSDLKINTLIDINPLSAFGNKNLRLYDFITLSEATMSLRQELFSDLIQNRNILSRLKSLAILLRDFSQLGINRSGSNSTESNLYAVKEICMYIEIIDGFYALLQGADLKSKSLTLLLDKISLVRNGEDFLRLRDETERLECKINKIKSITVGVNINSQLQPVEAGIVAINDTPFVSGNIIDKLLRAEIGKNEYDCIAPLEPVKGASAVEKASLITAINNGMNTVFSKSLTHWKDTIRRYTQIQTAWLYALLPELNFIIGCTEFLLKLADSNCPLCVPEFSKNETIQDFCDPCLVVNGEPAVKNGITFNSDGKIYILTGPNQGGKSVFTRAVGIAYAFLHLGLLIPAHRAEICPVDNIFTHFPAKNSDSYKKGRLAMECATISSINKNLSKNSLFLFDESLSSTSNYEATEIAAEILTAYAYIGCKGIFTTHLHDLCMITEKVNAQDGIKSICALLSATLSSEAKARTYKIIRGQVYGKSFASDIAMQYGLDRETILSEYLK